LIVRVSTNEISGCGSAAEQVVDHIGALGRGVIGNPAAIGSHTGRYRATGGEGRRTSAQFELALRRTIEEPERNPDGGFTLPRYFWVLT